MKDKLCLILLGIFSMLGCSQTVRLYPVQGPLSAQTPLPVLAARLTGALTSGDMSVVLNDGEICKGRWAQVRPQTTIGAGTASVPASDMSAVWDSVYGSGFYVSHVLGARAYARAVMSGNRGTVLDVEMYRREGKHADNAAGAITGVARDNKGNVYKVTL